MTRIYFDVTDVIEYSRRNNTVIGIPRVQLNTIFSLARKHKGDIYGLYFDYERNGIYEFVPDAPDTGFEFNGEQLLVDLGLVQSYGFLPGRTHIKSYLKRYEHNKLLRTLRKCDIYLSAILLRPRLRAMGLYPKVLHPQCPMLTSRIEQLHKDDIYVCMGSAWWHPQMWEFAALHRARGGNTVQMIHDLIPVFYPQYYSAKESQIFVEWLNHCLDHVAEFICVSKSTARDLREFAAKRNLQPNITSIPLAHEFPGMGRDTRATPSQRVSNLRNLRFVLCVGTIEHRKNNLMMLEVWKQLLETSHGDVPSLIFAGKYGRGGAEFKDRLAADPQLAKHVLVIHAPTDGDLAWLYQQCVFTIYPSTYEGWGLPVGEAAWFGKYCIASRATSVPEVCGNLADYVDPYDSSAIKAAISRALADRDYLQLKEEAIKTAKLRTWQDLADDIYHHLAGQDNISPEAG